MSWFCLTIWNSLYSINYDSEILCKRSHSVLYRVIGSYCIKAFSFKRVLIFVCWIMIDIARTYRFFPNLTFAFWERSSHCWSCFLSAPAERPMALIPLSLQAFCNSWIVRFSKPSFWMTVSSAICLNDWLKRIKYIESMNDFANIGDMFWKARPFYFKNMDYDFGLTFVVHDDSTFSDL